MVVFSLLHVNILNIYVLTPFLEPPYQQMAKMGKMAKIARIVNDEKNPFSSGQIFHISHSGQI